MNWFLWNLTINSSTIFESFPECMNSYSASRALVSSGGRFGWKGPLMSNSDGLSVNINRLKAILSVKKRWKLGTFSIKTHILRIKSNRFIIWMFECLRNLLSTQNKINIVNCVLCRCRPMFVLALHLQNGLQAMELGLWPLLVLPDINYRVQPVRICVISFDSTICEMGTIASDSTSIFNWFLENKIVTFERL